MKKVQVIKVKEMVIPCAVGLCMLSYSKPNYHLIKKLKLYKCEAWEMVQSVICVLSLSMRTQAQIPSIHRESQHGRPSLYSSTRETERGGFLGFSRQQI